MLKKYLPYILLLFTLLFASFIRLYKLDKVPAGFNYDEAMVSYNAYTLNNWGVDESGNKYPLLYIQSSENFHQALFFYITAVSEKIFGVSKFALRFSPIFFGILTIALVFFFVQKIFEKDKIFCDWIALSSSFLLTISPWHIYISRSGYELTIAQFFFLLGLYVFLQKFAMTQTVITLVLFLFAALTYRSYLIFLPLFAIVLFTLYSKSLKQTSAQRIFTVLFSLLFIAICFSIAINDPRRADSLFVGNLNSLSALAHIAQNFLRNYVVHFSLLLNFAPTAFDPKYWMVNRGLFYLLELPLLILGFVYLINTKHFSLKIFLAWLFLYPLPHSLTNFGYANRMSIILPLPQIIAGIGLWWLLKTLPKKIWLIVGVVIFMSFSHFWVDYFSYYPKTYGNFNHEGPEYVYDYIKENGNKYNRIIISRWNTHPVFFLFFSRYDLQKYLAEKKLYPTIDQTKVYAKIDNIFFVDNIKDVKPKPNDLFVDKKESFPSDAKPIKIIYLQNGSDFAWIVP